MIRLFRENMALVLVWILLLMAPGCLKPSNSWASADTLRPVADAKVFWNRLGCDSHYQCVNEEDPDGDVTKVYCSGQLKRETFQLDSTFVPNIDSLVIRINAKKTGTDTVKLNLGFDYWEEALWYFHIADSVTLTGEYGDYWVVSTADERDDPWTYQKINARRFGVGTKKPSGVWSANLTQVFVVVYYQEAQERKRPGGIVQDKDRRGIAEGGMAR
jgi:hypothetical protein